jgi:hypothetical protein
MAAMGNYDKSTQEQEEYRVSKRRYDHTTQLVWGLKIYEDVWQDDPSSVSSSIEQ